MMQPSSRPRPKRSAVFSYDETPKRMKRSQKRLAKIGAEELEELELKGRRALIVAKLSALSQQQIAILDQTALSKKKPALGKTELEPTSVKKPVSGKAELESASIKKKPVSGKREPELASGKGKSASGKGESEPALGKAEPALGKAAFGTLLLASQKTRGPALAKGESAKEESALDKGESALDKGESALDKGESALDKGESALDKGESALDKEECALDKEESALDKGASCRQVRHTSIIGNHYLRKAAWARNPSWIAGSEVRWTCLGGNKEDQEFITRAWGRCAKLNIQIRHVINPHEAHIRISFTKAENNWTYVGAESLLVDAPRPTMNYSGGGPACADHLIAHALGLGKCSGHNNNEAVAQEDLIALRKVYSAPSELKQERASKTDGTLSGIRRFSNPEMEITRPWQLIEIVGKDDFISEIDVEKGGSYCLKFLGNGEALVVVETKFGGQAQQLAADVLAQHGSMDLTLVKSTAIKYFLKVRVIQHSTRVFVILTHQ